MARPTVIYNCQALFVGPAPETDYNFYNYDSPTPTNDYSDLVTKGGIVVFDDYWIGEYVRAAWRKEDDDGVKWMDVVGAVDEIINDKTFLTNWRDVGLFGDKKIIERL